MEEKEINDQIKELQRKRKEMDDEIKSLEEQALALKREKEAENIKYLREHRDVILGLLHHNRSSCSDENPINGYSSSAGYARCNKCHLIEILDGYYCDGDFEVSFNVNISKVV